MDQQELVRGWQCQGMVEGMERKERKVGGRLGRGRIVIQAPCSRWGGVGKRAKGGGRQGMSRERACRLPRDSRGEVEGVTGQGGVEG